MLENGRFIVYRPERFADENRVISRTIFILLLYIIPANNNPQE